MRKHNKRYFYGGKVINNNLFARISWKCTNITRRSLSEIHVTFSRCIIDAIMRSNPLFEKQMMIQIRKWIRQFFPNVRSMNIVSQTDTRVIYSLKVTPVNAGSIVILGGAGTAMLRGKDVKEKIIFSQCIKDGISLLENNSDGDFICEQVLSKLEDSGYFNAGKGGDRTVDGSIELDSAVMIGKTLQFGAVTLSSLFQNPVAVARCIMKYSIHNVLSEPQLLKLFSTNVEHQWDTGQYVDRSDPSVESDKNQTLTLQSELNKLQRVNIKDYYEPSYKRYDAVVDDTIAVIVRDKNGNLFAASSTGGRHNKLSGRISPAASPGCDIYACNDTCAVAFSGHGERSFMTVAAFDIHARMLYQRRSIETAMESTLTNFIRGSTRYENAGFIGIDKYGTLSIMHTSHTMPWVIADTNGTFKTGGWTSTKCDRSSDNDEDVCLKSRIFI